ncbi:MAG: hypothetical protein ACRDJN_05530, partial [Chloroflexota bacterium]
AATTWLVRQVGVNALAVILHGAAGRGEDLPGVPLEFLLVVREAPAAHDFARWRTGMAARCGGAPLELAVVEAHRLGWLPPSVFQQSLLAGAVLLWGDPATLGAIPGWRPDQLDPRLALDEVRAAQVDLAAGAETLAAHRAAGALLIARRAYTPRTDEHCAALRRAWPEAPDVNGTPPAAFVARAAALVEDWLLTWEGTGPPAAARERYVALHRQRQQQWPNR